MNLKVHHMVLVIGLHLVFGQKSPCPDIFEYKYDDINEEWYGWISIPNPGYGTTSVSTEISTVDVHEGKSSLLTFKSLDDTVKDLERGLNLQYRQLLPYKDANDLPTLHNIKVNGKEICSGPEPENYGVILTQSSTLVYGVGEDLEYLPVIPTTSTPRRRTSTAKITVPIPSMTVTTQTTTVATPRATFIIPRITAVHFIPTKVTNNIDNKAQISFNEQRPLSMNKCGIKNTKVTELSYGGIDILPNEYPWLIAIYLVIEIQRRRTLTYACSATLISENTVLTAAHCTEKKRFVIIELGRHDKSNNAEEYERQTVYRENIIEHREYKNNSAHADIAILRIQTVSYRMQVSPICMWQLQSNLDSAKGVIVGWGIEEDHGSSPAMPKQLVMNVVSQEACRRVKKLAGSLSDDTFCAQSAIDPYRSGPCHGDSGGGFYVNIQNKWHLRGIISRSLGFSDSCDVRYYSVFVNVAKYMDWMRPFLN